MVAVNRKVRRRRDDIVAAVELGISNARAEAINNKIKVTVRMGYGFRHQMLDLTFAENIWLELVLFYRKYAFGKHIGLDAHAHKILAETPDMRCSVRLCNALLAWSRCDIGLDDIFGQSARFLTGRNDERVELPDVFSPAINL